MQVALYLSGEYLLTWNAAILRYQGRLARISLRVTFAERCQSLSVNILNSTLLKVLSDSDIDLQMTGFIETCWLYLVSAAGRLRSEPDGPLYITKPRVQLFIRF